MKRLIAGALASLLFVGIASAQNIEVIKERKATMKDFLDRGKHGTAMVKGEAPFDLEKAKSVFSGISSNAKKLPDLFPDDSKEGDETRALPAIWEKKDELVAIFAKLEKAAAEAAGSITDEDSFKAAWPTVMGNCGECHKQFRAEKK